VAGIVSLLKLKNTKKGDRYATFLLEDLLGTIEVIVWPDVYRNVHEVLASEEPVVIGARLDVSDERRQLIAQSIESAISLRDSTAKEAIVRVPADACSDEKFESLRRVFVDHRGSCNVKIVLFDDNHSETVISLADDLRVEVSESLCNKVEQLFGQPVMTFR
jgi:DNA polymerase-3 subunit alpha